MGDWRAAVYTVEQQRRLGVDTEGEPTNTAGPSSTGYREVATIVDIPKRNAERAAAKAAKARSRWKVAGAVAKAVVAMPMAIGIPVKRAPEDAIWAQATAVPVALPICPDTGALQISQADKIAMVKQKLSQLPPQIFSALDSNGDGYLSKEQLRAGFEARGDPLTDAELTTIVSIADVDGDGRISTSEFEALTGVLHQIASLRQELGVEF